MTVTQKLWDAVATMNEGRTQILDLAAKDEANAFDPQDVSASERMEIAQAIKSICETARWALTRIGEGVAE